MKKIVLASFLLLSTMSLLAQDRVFNYTYQSAVLEKGERELEVSINSFDGKEDYFRELETKIEFEVGLTSKLQTSFYLNTKQQAAFEKMTGEIVLSPSEISISNEWKYKFSDPVANRIGFAGYAEFTIATDELEIEMKAIFDKKIGRMTHAFNATLEPEWETTVIEGKKMVYNNLNYNFNYALCYNINKIWNLGAEIINRNIYVGKDKLTNSALFAGPTLGFNIDKFWINLSFSPQVTGLKNPNNVSGLNLNAYTKTDTKIIFSYSF